MHTNKNQFPRTNLWVIFPKSFFFWFIFVLIHAISIISDMIYIASYAQVYLFLLKKYFFEEFFFVDLTIFSLYSFNFKVSANNKNLDRKT